MYKQFYVTRGTKLWNQLIAKLEFAKEHNITPQWFYDSEPMIIKDVIPESKDNFVVLLER